MFDKKKQYVYFDSDDLIQLTKETNNILLEILKEITNVKGELESISSEISDYKDAKFEEEKNDLRGDKEGT